jgi:hypothetical protein
MVANLLFEANAFFVMLLLLFYYYFLLLFLLFYFIFFYREAVDFVLDELKAYEKGTDTYIIDGHFMPYSRFAFY